MRSSSFALVWVAAALAASGAVFAQVHAPGSGLASAAGVFMDVADVRPGMRGYGLTVFRGTRPERFDVEVIDVVHNFRPHMDLVLIRPSHPILEHAGTVAGMSGSPIYLNDRLVGAYAYGWEFGRDPVAGVTPIAAMMAELRRPHRTPAGLVPGSQIPIEIAPRPTPLGPGSPRAAGEGSPYPDPWTALVHRAQGHRERVETPYGALIPVASPLVVGGVSPGALRHLAEALEPFGIVPVQAGGGGTAQPPGDAPAHYEDGGAVAVRVLAGDISGNITGTVTHVAGRELVAFGHPMMGMGETAMPAAIARVMWILASERRSMKISEPVRNMGALVQDRPTGVVVDEAGVAPTLPVRVHVHGAEGAPHDDWNVTVASHRALVGRMVGTVAETALEETAGDAADLAWTVRSRVALRGRPAVEFVEHGASPEGVHGITSLAAPDLVSRLMDNAFGVAPVDRVDIDVELQWARDFSYIRSIALAREEVDPGQTVDLRVSLSRYGAAAEVRTVPLEVPRELAGREVDVEVSAGGETVPELPEPESLDDLVRNLTTRFPDDALVVTMRMPGQGVTLRGRVITNLPGSALDALRPAASTDSGDPLVNVRRVVVPVGRVVVGRDRLRLRVREVRL